MGAFRPMNETAEVEAMLATEEIGTVAAAEAPTEGLLMTIDDEHTRSRGATTSPAESGLAICAGAAAKALRLTGPVASPASQLRPLLVPSGAEVFLKWRTSARRS